MVIAAIGLIPLLIAMLTETYKRIHQRSDAEWKFGRAKLIRGRNSFNFVIFLNFFSSDMVKMAAAPPPLNLLVRPFLYICSVRKHGKMMCTNYATSFLAEDEHEGADELLSGFDNQDGHEFKHGISRIENALDWSIVVRRYHLGLKGIYDDHHHHHQQQDPDQQQDADMLSLYSETGN